MSRPRLSSIEATLPWLSGKGLNVPGNSKSKNIPKNIDWHQGFATYRDSNGTEWVCFVTYRTAAVWALKAQTATGKPMVVMPITNEFWAYRKR